MKDVFMRVGRPFVWLYNKTHWFTDDEAWAVFRFFAILEAVGWSLLIGAIVYRNLGLPEGASVVSFCGRIHGIGFVLYFLFAFMTARSMEWGWKMIAAAVIAGMPLYGSVVFERIVGRYRRTHPRMIPAPAEPRD